MSKKCNVTVHVVKWRHRSGYLLFHTSLTLPYFFIVFYSLYYNFFLYFYLQHFVILSTVSTCLPFYFPYLINIFSLIFCAIFLTGPHTLWQWFCILATGEFPVRCRLFCYGGPHRCPGGPTPRPRGGQCPLCGRISGIPLHTGDHYNRKVVYPVLDIF